MRIAVTMVALVALVCVPAVASAEIGVGGQSFGNVQGLSFKAKVGGAFALQGIFGYSSMGLEDPSVEFEGDTEELPVTLSTSTLALGGRVLLTIMEADGVDVYLGAGAVYHMVSASAEMDVDEYRLDMEADGHALEFSGAFGAEFRVPAMESLALSTEVGYSYMMYGEFEATATMTGPDSGSETGTLDPNATEHGFYVGVGVHYYF
jgi:hypothetical protein